MAKRQGSLLGFLGDDRAKSHRTLSKDASPEEKEQKVGVWTKEGSVLVLNSSTIQPCAKVVAFDIDDTLIATSSGRVFAKDRGDWRWWHVSVPGKLRELHSSGFKVVAFSNQAGIAGKGKSAYNQQKADMITGKISDIVTDLGFPIQAFLATGDDEYRKPSSGMFDLFAEKFNGGLPTDLDHSRYVGDAAGRPAGWSAGKKKDFSCSDRKFAYNCGLAFATPEEYFLNQAPVAFDWGGVDPSTLPRDVASSAVSGAEGAGGSSNAPIHRERQELVLFVGMPASGKTTYAKRYFVPHGYVWVNRDTLKDQKRCLKATQEALESGKSVVVDNTSPEVATRAEYIKLAQAAKCPSRCFYFQTSRETAAHLNYYRERTTKGAVPHIPRMAYDRYLKILQMPTIAEGFEAVHEVEFKVRLETPEQEKMFLQWAS